jgi:hypothetical protein
MSIKEPEQQQQVLLFKFDKNAEILIQLTTKKLNLDLLNQMPDSSLVFSDGKTIFYNYFLVFIFICFFFT